MSKYLILLSFLTVMACKDAPEQIPAYLNLKPFTVAATGGAAWQKITDGWLYVNGEYLGAYTLPAQVPVLAEGQTEIILFPGVKENGIEATPNIYPYLTKFTKTVALTAGQTTDIQPVTDYDPLIKYAFGIGRGDFDGGSFISLENRDTDNTINVGLTDDDAFAGKSVLMQVDTAHPQMEIATEKMENLPVLGAPQVWLELHYKSDVPFSLYMLSGPAETLLAVFQFNVTDTWNKIYLNLTGSLISTQQPEQRLLFRLNLPKDNAGNFTQDSGKVLLDNIRVVHF